ncbi:Sigma-W factor [Variovorax sp. SRS16]|uniref:RNA polymerase sigma-70 factor n=1 Tax=Variovorax sp. SRS16 TaxID=282217 RepID=UPI001318952B|nr:RNA polymerase sigma-70 factor [Variovorax sp. SRS16]VTU13455.1 Sigma-W factor [Variovorax sp. SRS16]
MSPPSETQTFLDLRPRLFGIAYRMLGTTQDAEDAVQEAYLRWREADARSLRSPQAWLVSVTTRLCIDRLRSLKVEREAYVGPWLPEPIVAEVTSPEAELEKAQHLSIAFLLMLERLSPEERAAFLLYEVLDFDYAEIADALQRSEGACRQLLYRARQRLGEARGRFSPSSAQHRALLEQFVAATTAGDIDRVVALLSEDAQLVADGGGKARVVLKPLHGAHRIARLFHAVARQVAAHGARLDHRLVRVNGELGLLRLFNGVPHSVLAFETAGDRILSIGIVANPGKMSGVADRALAGA